MSRTGIGNVILLKQVREKHFKKMKYDVGMTKNSVQKNKETREEIVERKRLTYYHPYIKPMNGIIVAS